MIQNIHGINQLYIQSDPSGSMPDAARAGHPAAAIAEPQDRVTLSKEAQNAKNDNGAGASKDEKNLSSEENQQVNDLKRRDAEVKAHEQAHMAAGGGVVQGGASYEYQRGPDGRMYAVGGEVQIDMSPENTPEATIAKMQQVQRAALAPAQPSGTDRAVAARAAQTEARARAEKTQANAPSAETAEPTQASPTEKSGSVETSQASPENENASPKTSPQLGQGNLAGVYVARQAHSRQPSMITGRRINLQA